MRNAEERLIGRPHAYREEVGAKGFTHEASLRQELEGIVGAKPSEPLPWDLVRLEPHPPTATAFRVTKVTGASREALHRSLLSLYELEIGLGVQLRTKATPDCYTAVIRLNKMNGTVVDGDHRIDPPVVIANPGQRSVSHVGPTRVLIVLIHPTGLDGAIRSRTGHTPTAPISFDPRVDPQRPEMASWLELVSNFAESSRAGLLQQFPLMATHFEQLLLHGLIDCQPHSLSNMIAEYSGEVASDILSRATKYCHDHAGDPVAVVDLANAAGMSVRALQRRFRDELGVTPLDYLRRVRLDRVHRDLVAIGKGLAAGSVSEVAHRWGFTHMGWFAKAYGMAYGHTPSQTARVAK